MSFNDNVSCEHKNCYINFDLASKDPDVYTYFVMDKPTSDGDPELTDEKIDIAANEDRVYVFCNIHSKALLEYIQKHGEVTMDYIESIVKAPHFEDDQDDTLMGNILGL